MGEGPYQYTFHEDYAKQILQAAIEQGEAARLLHTLMFLNGSVTIDNEGKVIFVEQVGNILEET